MTTPSLRLRAEVALRRHGLLPVAALVLLLVGAMAWALLLMPSGRDTAPAVAEALPHEADPAAALRPVLVKPELVNHSLRSLLAQAAQAGLEVGRVDYRWPEGERGSRVQVGLPLRGGYGALKQFVGGVLAASPGVSLDQWTMRREPLDHAADAPLDAMLWFSVWQTGLLDAPNGGPRE